MLFDHENLFDLFTRVAQILRVNSGSAVAQIPPAILNRRSFDSEQIIFIFSCESLEGRRKISTDVLGTQTDHWLCEKIDL